MYIITLVFTNKTYYVVVKGRRPGIYHTLGECRNQIINYPDGCYKRFSNLEDAVKFYELEISKINGTYTKLCCDPECDGFYCTECSIDEENLEEAWYDELIDECENEDFNGVDTVRDKPRINKLVYVDGASSGNGSVSNPKAGYGVYYGPGDGRNASIPTRGKTNQQAELLALKHGLTLIRNDARYLIHTYDICTDSKYAINCATKWAEKWELNGYTNAKGTPMKNQELIKDVRQLYLEIKEVYKIFMYEFKILYVPGHSGIEGNVIADKLAKLAAQNL